MYFFQLNEKTNGIIVWAHVRERIVFVAVFFSYIRPQSPKMNYNKIIQKIRGIITDKMYA